MEDKKDVMSTKYVLINFMSFFLGYAFMVVNSDIFFNILYGRFSSMNMLQFAFVYFVSFGMFLMLIKLFIYHIRSFIILKEQGFSQKFRNFSVLLFSSIFFGFVTNYMYVLTFASFIVFVPDFSVQQNL